LTPAPSGEVTLDIEVEAVPGESLTENNRSELHAADRIGQAVGMRIAYLGPAGTFTETP
jgi:hypothetical protein